MKAKQLVWTLVLSLLAVTTFQLPAQRAATARERFKEFKAEAEKGDAQAQWKLGHCYASGEGVTGNPNDMVKWWRKAAEQGLADAQSDLGQCYDSGNGVKWYRKAAEQGYGEAQCNLGVCQLDGNGVAKDAAEAAKWYRKAAEQGVRNAQANLGACYRDGMGVAKDSVQATKWFSLAGAKREQLNLRAKMTKEQIAEAQQLVREFKPRKVYDPDASPFSQTAKP